MFVTATNFNLEAVGTWVRPRSANTPIVHDLKYRIGAHADLICAPVGYKSIQVSTFQAKPSDNFTATATKPVSVRKSRSKVGRGGSWWITRCPSRGKKSYQMAPVLAYPHMESLIII